MSKWRDLGTRVVLALISTLVALLLLVALLDWHARHIRRRVVQEFKQALVELGVRRERKT